MIAAKKDYYEILGLARTASQDEIRVAYRRLARQYHPDVARNKEAGEEIFKEINEAYEVLSHPEKRRKYRKLSGTGTRRNGFKGYSNRNRSEERSSYGESAQEQDYRPRTKKRSGFEDFRGTFFDTYDTGSPFFSRPAADRSRGFNTHQSYSQRGTDIETDLVVSFKEVVTGVDRAFSFTQIDPLTGASSVQTIQLRVQSGLQEGQIICLPGKGSEGIGGGKRGDLILRVRFARNSEFRVRGLDLFRDLDIAPWVAAFGGYATVRTLTGTVSLRIPPRIRKGQTLRIRGRGLVSEHGRSGDLYVRVTQRFHIAPVARTLSFLRNKLAGKN